MWYVMVAFFAVVAQNALTATTLRVTIDCGSHEKESYGRSNYRSKSSSNSGFDVNSFCDYIHDVIPKAVKDGRFVLRESDSDQTGFSNTLVPMSSPPPDGFIPTFSLPKFRPKLKVPKINVPNLKAREDRVYSPPKVGSSYFPKIRGSIEQESSAERMEKFKKGVQKMLHVVKLLGQIDQYLSERTRILVDKLSKTFAD